MRKFGIAMFCIALCLAVALMFPQIGTSNLNVDSTNCACHSFPSGAGLHTGSTHTSAGCTACHAVIGDAPETDTCIVCHPQDDTGECELVNLHDPGKGGTCLTIGCHDTCAPDDTTTTSEPGGDTTTTTTSENTTCFATKIYGEGSDEVLVMRYLRNNVLRKSLEGRELIRLYYRWSPVIAKAIEKDEEFKEKMKEMIDGFLMLTTKK